jgi:hypothetical protein
MAQSHFLFMPEGAPPPEWPTLLARTEEVIE